MVVVAAPTVATTMGETQEAAAATGLVVTKAVQTVEATETTAAVEVQMVAAGMAQVVTAVALTAVSSAMRVGSCCRRRRTHSTVLLH